MPKTKTHTAWRMHRAVTALLACPPCFEVLLALRLVAPRVCMCERRRLR